MEKKSFLSVRMEYDVIRAIDKFVDDWTFYEGVPMTRSEVVRQAIEQHLDQFDYKTVAVKGSYIGVRMDATRFHFEDLFNMAADAQKAYEAEQDESKKYLLQKQFELLSAAVGREFSLQSFKGIQTPSMPGNREYRGSK